MSSEFRSTIMVLVTEYSSSTNNPIIRVKATSEIIRKMIFFSSLIDNSLFECTKKLRVKKRPTQNFTPNRPIHIIRRLVEYYCHFNTSICLSTFFGIVSRFWLRFTEVKCR